MRKILPLLFLSTTCFAQFNLETLKNAANSELGKKVKESLVNKLDDMRSDYDEASFNYAVALSDNAGLFESEERYKKNNRMLLDAFAATQGKEVTNSDKALSMNSVGEMMYASNKYTSAESSFLKAKTMLEEAQDSIGLLYAQVVSNLGLLYHTTGRYTLAEKWALKAKDIRYRKSGERSAVYASSLNNLAVLYKDMGRYNEAETLIQKAVETNKTEAGKESVPYALSLNNQAMIEYAVGRTQEAEKRLNQALDIAGKSLKDKSTNYVRLLTNLALMYQDLGKYKESEAIYLKAIKIKEGKLSTNHPDYAHLLNNLAALYVLMGKTKEVEANLKKAADIYKKKLGDEHPAYAATISNLGNFYRVNNRLTEAESLLKEARSIRSSALGESHPDFVTSLESLGLLYWKTGNITEASTLLRNAANKSLDQINRYFATMSEAEKEKLWNKNRSRFQHFYAFAVQKNSKYPILLTDMYNYQLSTKAILLSATNRIKQQILQSGDKALKAKYASWLDQKEELAHAYTLSKDELEEEKINVDSLERATNQLEKELSASSKIFSEGYAQKAIKTHDIAEVLAVGEAAIELIQLNTFHNKLTDTVQYAALILTKDHPYQPKLVLLKEGNALNKKYYSYYRNAIQLKQQDEYSYANFWQSIHEATKEKKIYLSLDGVYNQINLNTLQLPNGKYVLEEKELIFVTNSKEVLALKKPIARKVAATATLIGFPDYGSKGKVAKLPGTQKELETAKSALTGKQYKVTYLIKEQANEGKVKDIPSPKILHFATHGFFLPEPELETEEMLFGIASDKAKADPLLRAGLLLAGAENAMEGIAEDGILTAYEVTNLVLNNTEIVLLSACETGVGDVKNGEGVYGLQRAFQVAGANTVVMSLWKVNDESTQLLMSGFYKHFLLSGDRYKAFKQAQADLKAKFKEPYYWGAFVMIE